MVSVSGLARQTIKPWNSCVLKVSHLSLGIPIGHSWRVREEKYIDVPEGK